MTVRIELQCDVCRSAYFRAKTEDVGAARAQAALARWTRHPDSLVRAGGDICPRCAP